ncbi:protein-tyrosine phosphatase-like protein, partial [Lentinula raphanica]
QIAQLASQHNASEYSCLKYGPRGYPGRYIPLSVQSPQTFHELRARQAEWANGQAWWYSEKTPEEISSHVFGPSGSSELSSDSLSNDLAQQLLEAIDEQLVQAAGEANLDQSNSNGAQSHTIKTSASHPINISAIIPVEILALLSSHLMFTSNGFPNESPKTSSALQTRPTIFEVPSAFTLDRFILSSSGNLRTSFSPTPQNPILPSPDSTETPLDPRLRTRSHVTEALQAALNSGIKSGSATPVEEPRATTFHSNGSSVSLSITLNPLQAEAQLPSLDSIPAPSSTATPSFLLGNLFMSSCPGKKVRLKGPVKGRSGVCRDLPADLQRMKDLGVGCVVCCLDDNELEFLGAPWPEYQAATNKIGLDVLRLPTPEGLAPALTPSMLDKELTTLIHTYTLRGIPVLVHCRGGVGRAGVISACWILKLGLCGWSSTDSIRLPLTSQFPTSVQSCDGEASVKKDTLELVERVIAVVRRRRSMKAIETYEQVQFLVDFIEYLKSPQTQ